MRERKKCLMHTSSMWHPILLVFNHEEKSSMYTANNDGDNIHSCRTPLETIKYGGISAPHLIHSYCLVYQKISILTIRI